MYKIIGQFLKVFLFVLLVTIATAIWGPWSIKELTTLQQLLHSQFLKAPDSFRLVGTYRQQALTQVNSSPCALSQFSIGSQAAVSDWCHSQSPRFARVLGCSWCSELGRLLIQSTAGTQPQSCLLNAISAAPSVGLTKVILCPALHEEHNAPIHGENELWSALDHG